MKVGVTFLTLCLCVGRCLS